MENKNITESLISEIEFSINDTVYLKTDIEQEEHQVIGIMIRPTGIIYYVAKGPFESTHYAIELTKEKNTLKTLT